MCYRMSVAHFVRVAISLARPKKVALSATKVAIPPSATNAAQKISENKKDN